MKLEPFNEVKRLYDESLEFFTPEELTPAPIPGPGRIEYQNTFRTVPEKYLLKDNLLLLLKES